MTNNEDWEAVAMDHALTIVMLRAEIEFLKKRLDHSDKMHDHAMEMVENLAKKLFDAKIGRQE